MYVRAADVHFQPADLRAGVKFPRDADVLVHGKAADVCDDGLVKDLGELWQLALDHRVDARILQADGVEHPGIALRDARAGVAEARRLGRALAGKAAEAVDVVKFGELIAIAEGAGGRDDGIVQVHAAKVYNCIHQTTSPR